ncbi:hypothetical protein [Methylobacter sp.]|uniref:hypothetical protein n=1 Tax=Methylobacter sp. TaxID=2051955 RepID=UPI002487D736|nr:hypothetical protein [Methylobacter sp.]MDI1278054.1 hypothetical protein [Methylobacter sp.]
MAKTIIIIEDTDTKTESFEVKVLRFQSLEEQAGPDTAAIAVGDHIAAAVGNAMAKLQVAPAMLPMQSDARH